MNEDAETFIFEGNSNEKTRFICLAQLEKGLQCIGVVVRSTVIAGPRDIDAHTMDSKSIVFKHIIYLLTTFPTEFCYCPATVEKQILQQAILARVRLPEYKLVFILQYDKFSKLTSN